MSTSSALQTYVVPEGFEKALKSIRGILNEVELEIVGEFELSCDIAEGAERANRASRILLVSCPILDFEAVAFGRAAAVFFPLHILVASEQHQTRVSVVNQTGLFDARLPVGAGDPLNRLVARVGMAFESMVQRPDAESRGRSSRTSSVETGEPSAAPIVSGGH